MGRLLASAAVIGALAAVAAAGCGSTEVRTVTVGPGQSTPTEPLDFKRGQRAFCTLRWNEEVGNIKRRKALAGMAARETPRVTVTTVGTTGCRITIAISADRAVQYVDNLNHRRSVYRPLRGGPVEIASLPADARAFDARVASDGTITVPAPK